MTRVLAELCCGTSAVSLYAMGRCRPLTGYMGAKGRDAAVIVTLLGADAPDEVVLIDAGPWGDVWTTLRNGQLRKETSMILREWHRRGSLVEVWRDLHYPPPAEPAHRVAQYLSLQARAAGCIPIWWSPERERWESPSGGRATEAAHQKGTSPLARRGKQGSGKIYPASPGEGGRRVGKLYRSHPSRGLVHIETLARRVDALQRLDWGRVTVIHGDVRLVAPIPGALAYFDPPYATPSEPGKPCPPRYAALLPRADVLHVAHMWGGVTSLTIVSEGEPLPLDGWQARRLRSSGKPEWLTMSRAPIGEVPEQLELFSGAAA